MRQKLSKYLLLSALLFSISFFISPPSCSAESAKDLQEVEAAVSVIASSILEGNIDTLMELSYLKDSNQFDKKNKIYGLLSRYISRLFQTTKIETQGIVFTDINNATVVVHVHRITSDFPDKIRPEIWYFTKGKSEKNRGKWLFLIKE